MNHDEKTQNMTDEYIVLEYPIPSKCTIKYLQAPIIMYKIFIIIQAISLIVVTNANLGNIYFLYGIFMYLLY